MAHIELQSGSEAETRSIGAGLMRRLKHGDVVLLEGDLGSGKTTLVRGALESLGVTDPVRSPTYNLIQEFATDPQVMHADLYRVKSWEGIGLEEYLFRAVSFIEWPDRAIGLLPFDEAWQVRIEFDGVGRRIIIDSPAVTNAAADDKL